MPSLKFQNGICLPALRPSSKPIKWLSASLAPLSFLPAVHVMQLISEATITGSDWPRPEKKMPKNKKMMDKFFCIFICQWSWFWWLYWGWVGQSSNSLRVISPEIKPSFAQILQHWLSQRKYHHLESINHCCGLKYSTFIYNCPDSSGQHQTLFIQSSQSFDWGLKVESNKLEALLILVKKRPPK